MDRAYPPFAILALLEYGGDFSAAAKALAAHGYGDKNAREENQTGEDDSSPFQHALTELGNAQRLQEMFGQDIRYCASLGWLAWDGTRWKLDENDALVSRRYALMCREMGRQAEEILAHAPTDPNHPRHAAGRALKTWAKASESNNKRISSLQWTQRLSGITTNAARLDTDIWLLNCQNGTLDLRTGTMRPHDRDDLITRIAPVAYDPDATCPTWDDCLLTWLPGTDNPETGEKPEHIREFLQRAFGYSLSGSTGEETAFFLFGTGRNGKSKFVGALEHILGFTGDGGYAARVPFTTLTDEKRGGGVTPELVNLVGARFAVASEPAAHQRFNDALIKDLTGSDRLTVNPKHRPQFEFKPQFKLWIYGNHKPRLNAVDEGIKARLPLIPFTVTIPAEQRDPHLEARLRAEAEGILAWAVRGFQSWQQSGLTPPPSILEATTDYHTENDPFAGFFEECTVLKPDLFATISDIMEAYKEFAAISDNVKMPHINAFAEALRHRGAQQKVRRLNGKTVRGWENIGIKTQEQAPQVTRCNEALPPTGSAPPKGAGGQNEESVTPVTPVTPDSEYSLHAYAHNSSFLDTAVTGVTDVTPQKEEKEVIWERKALSKGAVPEWRVEIGDSLGFGATQADALLSLADDPFLDDRQRAIISKEYKRIARDGEPTNPGAWLQRRKESGRSP